MTTVQFTTNKIFKKAAEGFTLIELLIVIAVIGVLAAVVLAAINPAEQLKRGRDSSRLQSVAQLGHAMQAYVTAQGKLPTVNNTWQDSLVASGDISVAIQQPSGSTVVGSCQTNSPAVGKENDFCFIANGVSNFYITTLIESNLYVTKASSGAVSCAASPVGTGTAMFIYDSTVGRAGEICNGTNTTVIANGNIVY